MLPFLRNFAKSTYYDTLFELYMVKYVKLKTAEATKMNMFEEAKAIESMLAARGITQATLASILGVSQPYIANKLRLLHFPDNIREMIVSAGLSERHARTLLRLRRKWQRR